MARKPGKKIEVLKFQGKLHIHEVELRLDAHEGEFFADLGGQTHKNRDLSELKKTLQQAANQLDDHKFSWWIEYSFETQYTSRTEFRGWSTHRGDKDTYRVSGINFQFRCVEATEEIDGWYLRRHVTEKKDGTLVPRGEYERERTRRYRIPYTDARWATLVKVREGLAQLQHTLDSVFNNTEEDLIKLLDGAGRTKLLGIGKV